MTGPRATGHRIANQQTLVDLVDESRKPGTPAIPPFVLFLGAGASIDSGVPAAGQLIQQWKGRYFEQHAGPSDDIETFFQRPPQNEWFGQGRDYSELFERLYHMPPQRRDFIEQIIGKARPSIGYIYLALLLQLDVFNVVLTTNFDDLVNEACHAFSDDVRPIVCAHDSSVRLLRLTSPRPKVVKLHGDFLFDNIQNTVVEVSQLRRNMKEKLGEFASETGLVVVGYSGQDDSVMTPLSKLLLKDGGFPRGVYWCVRDVEAPLPRLVERLARESDRFRLVKINGFDDIMARLYRPHRYRRLVTDIFDPKRLVTNRLNRLRFPREKPAEDDPIEPDLDSIDRILELQGVTPLDYNAARCQRRGDLDGALECLTDALREKPESQRLEEVFWMFKRSASAEPLSAERRQLLGELYEIARSNEVIFAQTPWTTWNIAMSLVELGYHEEAELLLKRGKKLYDHARENAGPSNYDYWNEGIYEANCIFVELLKQSKGGELPKPSDDQALRLQSIARHETDGARLGACILLRRFEDAAGLLRRRLFTHPPTERYLYKFPLLRYLFPRLAHHHADLAAKLKKAGLDKLCPAQHEPIPVAPSKRRTAPRTLGGGSLQESGPVTTLTRGEPRGASGSRPSADPGSGGIKS